MKKRAIGKILLSITMIISLFVTTVMPTQASYANGRNIGDSITDIYLSHKGSSDKPADNKFQRYEEVRINIDWDASRYTDLVGGDYLRVSLPKNMQLSRQGDLDLKIGNKVVGKASFDVQNGGGGSITMTLTDEVNGLENVKGNLYAFATFLVDDSYNTDVTFPFQVEGNQLFSLTHYIEYITNDVSNEVLVKWEDRGARSLADNTVGWFIRLNLGKKNLNGATIHDRIQTENATYRQDLGPIIALQAYNNAGEWIDAPDNNQRLVEGQDYTVSYGKDGMSMDITFISDAINGKQAKVSYYTTYPAFLTTITNDAKIVASDGSVLEKDSSSAINLDGAGGSIKGTKKGQIRIINKEKDSLVMLEGGEFKIEGVGTLVTGADGTVTSELLKPGDYKVTQTKAKDGYKIDSTEHTVTVPFEAVVELVVENEKIVAAPTKGSLKVKNIDKETKAPLQNGVFKLFTPNGEQEFTITGTDGTEIFTDLEPGSYTVYQETPPNGYQHEKDTVTVLVNAGEESEIVIENTKVPPKPTTGKIKLINLDSKTNAPLKNGVFKITGPSVDFTIKITDDDGSIETKDLPAGKYTIVQITEPDGDYLPNKNAVEVEVVAGDTVSATIKNDKKPTPPKTGQIRITNQEEGFVPTLLNNAEFEITSPNGEKFKVSTPDGVVVTKELEPGVYTIRQVTPPTGDYKLNENEYQAQVTAGNITAITILNKKNIVPPPAPTKGNLKITNMDKNEDKLLLNAEFEILNEAGVKIETVKTEQGFVVKEELAPGVYKVKQVKAPDGEYKLNPQEESATVEAGKTAEVVIRNEKTPAAPQKGKLRIVNKDKNDDKLLSNAQFEVSAADGSKFTITTNDGTVETGELTPGMYTVKQLIPPADYKLNDSPEVVEVKVGETAEVVIKNEKLPATEGKIQITNLDKKDNAPLTGGVFKITRQNVDVTLTVTESNGVVISGAIAPGEYKIVQTTAPNGYKLNNEAKTVQVVAGQTAEVTILNEKDGNQGGGPGGGGGGTTPTQKGVLKVINQDEQDKSILKNARFEITSASGNFTITTLEGMLEVKDLEAGQYTVKQIAAPTGYQINPTPQTIQVEAGKTTEIIIYNTKQPVITDGQIQITNLDKSNNAPLSGAKFKVTGANVDAELTVTDTNGIVLSERLAPGEYKIVQTTAPSGYKLNNEEKTATVVANEIAKVTILNEKDSNQGGGPGGGGTTPAQKGSLQITNQDEKDNSLLKNAQFEVSGPQTPTFKVTTLNGVYEVKDLDPGEYTVKQLIAPSGYKLNTTAQTVKVEAGKMAEVLIKNVKDANQGGGGNPGGGNTLAQKATIIVVNEDRADNSLLRNARFEITSNVSSRFTIMTLNGRLEVKDLEPGEYTIVQISPPSGNYKLNPTPVTVELKSGDSKEVIIRNEKDSPSGGGNQGGGNSGGGNSGGGNTGGNNRSPVRPDSNSGTTNTPSTPAPQPSTEIRENPTPLTNSENQNFTPSYTEENNTNLQGAQREKAQNTNTKAASKKANVAVASISKAPKTGTLLNPFAMMTFLILALCLLISGLRDLRFRFE